MKKNDAFERYKLNENILFDLIIQKLESSPNKMNVDTITNLDYRRV